MQLIFLTQKRTVDFQGTLWVTGGDIWDFTLGVTSAPQGLPIKDNVNTILCNVGNLLSQRIRNESVLYSMQALRDSTALESLVRDGALSLHVLFLLIEIVDGGSGSSPGGGRGHSHWPFSWKSTSQQLTRRE